ncbi:hypothetical protein GCM10027160_43480 [Streptomyces calidiresistens]
MDLPEPLGPTTQVMPGSNRKVVAEAKDLNPRRVRLLRCTPRDFTGHLRMITPVPAPPPSRYGRVERLAREGFPGRSAGGRGPDTAGTGGRRRIVRFDPGCTGHITP